LPLYFFGGSVYFLVAPKAGYIFSKICLDDFGYFQTKEFEGSQWQADNWYHLGMDETD